MKSQSKIQKPIIYLSVLFMSMVALVSCDKDDDDDGRVNNVVYNISGAGDGSQVSPPIEGTGSSTFTGTLDSTNKQLIFTTNWSNLVGSPTHAMFYSGASGSVGDSVGTAWVIDSTVLNSSTYKDTISVTAEQLDNLINGRWYYQIATDSFMNGEIRGQLTATRQ